MSLLALDIQLGRGGFSLDFQAELTLSGITVLFGPNGSGKTTVLRAIAGLADKARGRIEYAGETWLDSQRGIRVPAHRRRTGMVFQDARLFSHLTVAGNLRFAERRAAPDGPVIDRDGVIERFDLGPLLAAWPEDLSGGERQRVAIGRALVSRPRMMLMDEPLSALDIVRRSRALAYVERISGEFGVPVIYVTHAIDEMARLADQLVLIDGGRAAAAGGVAETLARLDLPPLTGRFEAGVLLEGTIAGHDEPYQMTRVAIGRQAIEVPRLDYPEGRALRLRVRARDVSLALARPRGLSIRNIVQVTVAEVATEAETAYAEVRLLLEGQDLRARITRQSAEELRLQPGNKVFALIKSVALDRRLLSRAGTGAEE